jgi:ABC-2 type transport system ATP-binding protein
MPEPSLAVHTWALTKTFRGHPPREDHAWTDALIEGVGRLFRPPERKTVVDRVDLAVEAGEFFGVIGSNGAGKTTLLKLLSGLLYPDAGGGAVNGYDLRRERSSVRRSVVIARSGLTALWQLNGRENLLFRARMCGLSGPEAAERADYVLERLELTHKAYDYSWNWSAGEFQKFSLALTFIARTPLVLLDEPTSHLDPRTARLIRDFVTEELNRQNGQTILMSTHYLEEADMLCQRVAVLHRGRILACDTPSNLKRAHAPDRLIEVRVGGYTADMGAAVRRQCGLAHLAEHFEDVATGQALLHPRWAGAPPDPEALRRAIEAAGGRVLSVNRVEPGLEDVYFTLTGGQGV